MHDFLILKPAYSLSSSLPIAVVMCWRMMRLKTLLVLNCSVMSLQLLLSDRLLFFVSLMIVPLFQALGIITLSRRPGVCVE